MKDNLAVDINNPQLMLFQHGKNQGKIRQVCNLKNFACGLFFDLQKAFDTVSYDILLKKLKYYGTRGITNSWLQSYLNDRMQLTLVNKCQSSKKYLKYGVPQGSVLGLLLFILLSMIYTKLLNLAQFIILRMTLI